MKIQPGTPLSVSLRWDNTTTQPVGRLAYRDRRAFLEYDPDFLRQGFSLSPLHHPVEPGVVEPYSAAPFEGLHGMFADSLPDGWGRLLIDRRARQLGIEPATLTPLDRLACVGETGIGALTYAPAVEVWGEAEATLDLDMLAADAKRILSGQTAEVLDQVGRAGGSPGGARPKVLIAINDTGEAVHGSAAIPDGFTPYLVKFPGKDDPTDIAAIEYAYAQMAQAAGLEMAATRLLEGAQGQRYFATERFDRIGHERVHVHSASGLLYADPQLPSLDYKDLIRLTRAVTRDRRDAIKMFRLAVFNVLAHNRDDHARQFSFLMDRAGSWALAPAYDLTFMAGPGGEHSTSTLGHGQNITRTHLVDLAKEADLSIADASEIVDQVASVVQKWNEFAEAASVTAASRRRIATRLKETINQL